MADSKVVDWREIVIFYDGAEKDYPVYEFGRRVFAEEPLQAGQTYPWAQDIPDDDD